MESEKKPSLRERMRKATRGNVKVRADHQTPSQKEAPKVSITFFCEPYIKETLRKMSALSRRSLSVELCIGLEKYLESLGLWPEPVEEIDTKCKERNPNSIIKPDQSERDPRDII